MYQLLIADDEIIERKVLHKTLKKHFGDECEIFQAANGREALELFREKMVQIVILDIEMPGIDGIQAAQEMRRLSPQCCIIFLTAFDDFNYAKKAITIRALDYLLKPYDDQELIMVVEEALRMARANERVEALADVPKEAIELRDANQNIVVRTTGNNREAKERTETADHEESGQMRMVKVKEHIEAYIRSHFQEEISMQDAAKAMNYSEPYFCKLFKQNFSQNFTSYLTSCRIEEAKRRLADPTTNVKDVGIAVGYMDSNYFAKVFRRTTGLSPTDYRNQLFSQQN